MITVNNLSKVFRTEEIETTAVNNVSFTISEGEFVAIMGPSGCGKSTLLNVLGLLDNPTSGSYQLLGEEVGQLKEKDRTKYRKGNIGFVFQSVSLIPMMNAFENVEFSLRLAGIKEGRKERVEECLRLVGLGNRMEHMPQEMSGGEQQRVAIARALAHRPKVIFADEPTAELDTATAAAVMKLFRDLVEKEDVTIVMTTHDVGLMSAGTLSYELEDGAVKTDAVQE